MAWAKVGSAESSPWSFVQTRFSCGKRPVSMAMRDGTQSGAGQYALPNSTPRAASRSRLGVSTIASP